MKLLKLVLVVFLQIYAKAAPPSPSVLIIGSGASGIAAASRLLQHNFTVQILEAENRIGGRIQSIFFGDSFIDLGAESCHGVKNNIVYDLVKDLNILQHADLPKAVYHSSKKKIEFGEDILDIIDSIYGPDGHRDEAEGVNLGEYCIKKYNSTIYAKFKDDLEKLEVAKNAFELFRHIVLDYEGAFSWFEPSAKSDYTDCEGDKQLKWNGLGYKTILEVLIQKFPSQFKKSVLLNKEVVQVLYNCSLGNVITVCSDNTQYKSKHVIFTPSIGVLKENHQKLFVPPLIKKKQLAIKSVGFGAVIKVAMYFKNQWWENDDTFSGFHLIWSEDDRIKVQKEFPHGPFKEDRSWLTEFYSILTVPKNPNVLVAWLTGDLVPEVEQMTNETMIDGLKYLLKKFLNEDFNVTGPDAIIRSSWYSNPHFRGTYSYQTLQARRYNKTAEMELAKPVLNKEGVPVLLFAGEATHSYFYSTVHGAIESGFREADRIINFYKK